MKTPSRYKKVPLGFNRLAVIASATVSKEKNTIHCITEADITEPRRLISEHFARTGNKLSLTAYIVKCLADTISVKRFLNPWTSEGHRISHTFR